MRGLWAVVVCAGVCMATLSGCYPSESFTVSEAKTQSIPSGKTVALSVSVDVPEPEAVHQDVARRLRERLFASLVSEGIFASVVHLPAPSDYVMQVKIRGAREVDMSARIFLMMAAGPNTTSAAVTVRHQESDQIVTAFEATGLSKSHPLASGSSLDDAVRRTAEKIIEGLR